MCEHVSRYNPLYICTGVGLGKTHLLNAIGLELQGNTNNVYINREIYVPFKIIKKNYG